jgi:hypothetical protein
MSPLALLMVERPPTRWGEHLVATAVLLVVLAGLYLLLWRGWRRRAARQADLPPLPPVADQTVEQGTAKDTLDGVYLGTTSAEHWLDRIVAHRLGERANAGFALLPAGVVVHRDGSEPFLIPLAALAGARLDRGLANQVVGDGAVVVLTWRHGERLLDTGLRGPSPAANARWVAAVEDLRSRERTP